MDPSKKPRTYVIHTSSEADAFASAAADGKHGRNYAEDEQAGIRRHERHGSRHAVHLTLTPEEAEAGLTLAVVEKLTKEQDADAVLMFFYIAQVLAPPTPQPRREYTNGVIDFDDVIAMIGWDPRSTEERREMHRRVWNFIRFGERAQVVGKRAGKYKDKHTGQLIETEIHASPWRIHKKELPEQKSLYPESEVPVRVEIAMAPEWANILAAPETAQYLPLGEVLGAIKGNKPSGAWARVIGLSLAGFWRRNPAAAFDGSILPTRRELVDRYPPKTGPVGEILESIHNGRAIDYWCGALKLLVKSGFIGPEGEPAITAKEMRTRYPFHNWGDAWLDEGIHLHPGPKMEGFIRAVNGRALAPSVPARKPKKR